MDIDISYANISDYKQLAKIYTTSLQRHLEQVGYDKPLDLNPKSTQWMILDSIIADPSEKSILVAKNAGEPVGFIVFGSRLENIGPNRISGEIFQLYVDPQYWRCKIGKKLIDKAIDLMAEHGHGNCLLWVIKRAEGTLAFYHQDGWEKANVSRPDFYQNSIERICLQKSLINHPNYKAKQKISLQIN